MAICKSCKGPFTWKQVGEKWHAIDADGSNHWASCASRAKQGPLVVYGPRITGESYRTSCGLCDVLPWEECGCSFTRGDASVTGARESQMSLLELEAA